MLFVTRKGWWCTDLNAFANQRASGIIAPWHRGRRRPGRHQITDGTKGHPHLTAQGMSIRFAEHRSPLDGPHRLRRQGHHPGGATTRWSAPRWWRRALPIPHRDRERLRQAHRRGGVPDPGRGRQGHHRHQDHRAERPRHRRRAGEGRRPGDAGHQRRHAHSMVGEGSLGHRAPTPRACASSRSRTRRRWSAWPSLPEIAGTDDEGPEGATAARAAKAQRPRRRPAAPEAPEGGGPNQGGLGRRGVGRPELPPRAGRGVVSRPRPAARTTWLA